MTINPNNLSNGSVHPDVNFIRNGFLNLVDWNRFEHKLSHLLNLTMVLGVFACFSPNRQNFILVALLGFWSLLYIWSFLREEISFSDRVFLGLVVLSLVSIGVSRETSYLNFLLYVVLFLAPFTVPLLYKRYFDKKYLSSILLAFSLMFLVECVAFILQWSRFTGNPDIFRGTTFSVHHFPFLMFMMFLVGICYVELPGFSWGRLAGIVMTFPFIMLTVWPQFRTLNLVISIACLILVVGYVANLLIGLLGINPGAIGHPGILLYLCLIFLVVGGNLYLNFGWEIRKYARYLGSFNPTFLVVGSGGQDSRDAGEKALSKKELGYSQEDVERIKDALDYRTVIGMEIPITESFSAFELNILRKEGELSGPLVKIAATYELLTTLHERAWWGPIIGLGPGNVNSRAATHRAKKYTGTGKPHPLLGTFKSPYTHFYHVRWANDEFKQKFMRNYKYIRSGIAERPLGSWQMVFAELGVLGLILVMVFFLSILYEKGINPFHMSLVNANIYLLFLTLWGIAFFIRAYEYHDLIVMFWFTFFALNCKRSHPND